MLGVLAKLRDLILTLETQLAELQTELLARVQDQVTPKGLGDLTLVTLDGEVCDWHRFSNRKQIGSYTGCGSGEHSSGNKRRVGGIDRMGNGRVRALLVEAVWRFLHWQPNWHAALKMKTKLGAGTAMKRKEIAVRGPGLGNWPIGPMALAHRPLHPGRTRLGAGLTFNPGFDFVPFPRTERE